MAYRTQLSGYVKFLRGTPAAWEQIESKDPDTLYFIAEPSATRGQLYLGNKLISGGGSGGDITNISIGDLTDVLIGNNIPADAVLIYNEQYSSWTPVSLEVAIATVIGPMVGATAEDDGLSGLVPQPLTGQQNLFLRGDATWADPTTSLRTLMNDRFSDLYGNDSGTIREIAQSLIDDLVGNAPTSLDTLEELATWVSEHDDVINIAQAAEDIENLTTAMFGTLANPAETDADLAAMVQEDGVVRILTNLQTIILGSEQQPGLQAKVGALELNVSDNTAAINTLNTSMTTINSRIDGVEDRLRWTDVVVVEDGE